MGHDPWRQKVIGVEGHDIALVRAIGGHMGGEFGELGPFVIAGHLVLEGQPVDPGILGQIGTILAAQRDTPIGIGLGCEAVERGLEAGFDLAPVAHMVAPDQRDDQVDSWVLRGGQGRVLAGGEGYGSSRPFAQHFGLSKHETASVEITWPDGAISTLEGQATGRRIGVHREP